MASYHFGFETVWPTLVHRSQCCHIDSKCLLSPLRTCSARNFLNHKLPIAAPQRPSSLHFCIFCSESDSQARFCFRLLGILVIFDLPSLWFQFKTVVFLSHDSTKKPKSTKPGRASKRDTALRTELQLFLASAGLPSDQVPSTTELSNRGREDLAKIVRRRGYKAVARLLSSSDVIPNVESKGFVASNVKHGAVTEGSVQPSLNGSARPGRSLISDDTVQGSDSRFLIEQPKGNNISFREDGDLEMSTRNDVSIAPYFDGSPVNLDSLTEKHAKDHLLHERALNFVKTGQLDHLEGENDDDDEEDLSDDGFEDSSDEDEAQQKSAEAVAVEKAARLRSKLLPYIKGGPFGKFDNQGNDALVYIMQRKQEVEHIYQDDSGIQPASTKGTQLELDNIKSTLHSREMELLGMSRELEEAKAQLALLQAKSTAELAQAKQVALEKDIRLKSADEALGNLKQVQIEYWGVGKTVELAGSFNGWTHFLFLESDPTSEITKSDGSSGPMMWETELWLYPGIYEIKFIVDGNWQIDERREVVLRNSHLNNILRVEL